MSEEFSPEKVQSVVDAWLRLVEINPGARTLGGPRSAELWSALDDLAVVEAVSE